VPEGPEIRLAADRIARVLVGETIEDATFAFPALKRYERRVKGATVTAIDTRGKAMLTRFDNGLTLYSHNQLYGRWYTCRRGEPPSTSRSLRVALHTGTHSALLYSASDVEILTPKTIDRHPFLTRVGPDILDESLTPDAVAERLMDDRFRNRGLGGLYLDQAYLAGIGNYLRSEILFVAGEHPASKPSELDRRALKKLARDTLAISRRSYRTRGVTVTPTLASSLKRKGQTYRQYRFWVFGREDRPCHRCASTIVRMDVSSRGLFYCPSCQQRRS
jgi:endonuclease-8